MGNNRGQGLVEYLILVALIGVASIAIVRALNESVDLQFTNTANAIRGHGAVKYEKDALSKRYYKKKDFSNFMNGAGSTSTDEDNEEE